MTIEQAEWLAGVVGGGVCRGYRGQNRSVLGEHIGVLTTMTQTQVMVALWRKAGSRACPLSPDKLYIDNRGRDGIMIY